MTAFQINHNADKWAFDASWYRFRDFNLHKPGRYASSGDDDALENHPGTKTDLIGIQTLYIIRPQNLWLPGWSALENKTRSFGWSPYYQARFSGASIDSPEHLLPPVAEAKFED